jgi:membrane protease YdiL (CAAX protease family)
MAESPDLKRATSDVPHPDPALDRSHVLPRAVRAGALAIVLTAMAGGVWSALLLVNLATTPALPWSAVVVVGVGLAVWRWLIRGRDPTRKVWLRHRLRANSVPAATFGWALLAGLLSIVALIGLWIVIVQVAGGSGRSLPDESGYPALTVALVLVMASLVGSITEEAAFRGYFQGYLERSMAAPMAIATTCLVMAPLHALTQGFVWTTVLFYLTVDAIFGLTAHLIDSILPGIVIHATGLLVFFVLIWPGDAGRAAVTAGGANLTFWLHVAQALGFAFLAALVFRHLAGIRARPSA